MASNVPTQPPSTSGQWTSAVGQLAARDCGVEAQLSAAVETIRRGFDKFVIVGGQYANNVGVVGYTPIVANTYGTYRSSTTTLTGGQPIIAGSHDQGLVVKMFKEGDPAGDKAVPARESLGPKWKEAVDSNAMTCL